MPGPWPSEVVVLMVVFILYHMASAFFIGLTPYVGYAGPLALGGGVIVFVIVFFCKFRLVFELLEARRVDIFHRIGREAYPLCKIKTN